ncbi:hypothetical protein ABB02_01860 [Clostridiaceae bacterium JG1575]|nr:hypothetical protein ABB02_01860 [Clostridiaceae bacterium JG1575]
MNKATARHLFHKSPLHRPMKRRLQQSADQASSCALTAQCLATYERLLMAHPNDAPQVQAHTLRFIFPAIAYYETLAPLWGEQRTLATIKSALEESSKPARRLLRFLLRFRPLRRRFPAFCRTMTGKNYGPCAGFRYELRSKSPWVLQFDMLECPYVTLCRHHGCPELTALFCDLDDFLYADLHPDLLWQRKGTLGRGAPQCDFFFAYQGADPRLTPPNTP